MSEVKNYSSDLQELFVQFMLTDPQLFTRIMGIVDERHFDRPIRDIVKFLIEYSEDYSTLPTVEMIKAETGQDIELLDNVEQHNDWFIDEFETFCRHKAIERAIVNSADLLEEGRYGEVETTIKMQFKLD